MEHRILLGGGECWLPFARSRIAALRALSSQFVAQKFIMPDGANVVVSIEPNHEYIRIDGGGGTYMESGVLDTLTILSGFADSYMPSLICFTDAVAANIGNTVMSEAFPNASRSRHVRALDKSHSAAGCSVQSADVTDYVLRQGDFVEVSFHSDPPAFCDPLRVIAAKQLIVQVPASKYTGKMKRFVQALYGSKRVDYKISAFRTHIQLQTSFKPDLSKGESPHYYDIRNGYPTDGLFTVLDPAYPADFTKRSYLFIAVGLAGITYRLAQKAPSVMPRSAFTLDAVKAESYVLSTLVPSDVELTAIGPSMADICSGWERFAYGWHFNMNGDRASIVLFRPSNITGPQYPAITPATTTNQWEAKLITLEFGYAAGQLTYACSVGATGFHMPFTQSRVFYPDVDSMRMLTPPPTNDGIINWNCYPSNAQCPLYCYYDTNDTLVVVTANNTSPVVVPAYVELPPDAYFWINLFPDTGFFRETTQTPEKIMLSSSGIRAEGLFEYMGESSVSFGDTTTNSYFLDKTTPKVIVGYEFGTGIPQYASYFATGGSRSLVERDKTTSSVPILVIPDGDASSVIAGMQTRTTNSGEMRTLSWLDDYVFNYDDRYGGSLRWSSGHCGIPAYAMVINMTSEQAAWDALMEASRPVALTTSCALYSALGSTSIPNILNAVFTVAGADGVISAPMLVQTSCSGAMRTIGLSAGGREYYGGWPGVLYSSAVGWA